MVSLTNENRKLTLDDLHEAAKEAVKRIRRFRKRHKEKIESKYCTITNWAEHKLVAEIYCELLSRGFNPNNLCIEEPSPKKGTRRHFDLAYYTETMERPMYIQVVSYEKRLGNKELNDLDAFCDLDGNYEAIVLIARVNYEETSRRDPCAVETVERQAKTKGIQKLEVRECEPTP